MTDLVTYYTEATRDYEAWSPGFNMHFGYWRWPMNPFRLEAMLEEMSWQVLKRLRVQTGARLYDLGCGLGAPSRHFARRASVDITAFSLVPWQIEHATQLTKAAGLSGRVNFVLADYTKLPVAPNSADAVFSIEAACHDRGPAKAAFLAEAARVLKPGGRLVVADGFTRRIEPGPWWYRRAMGVVTNYWALECFADIGAFQRQIVASGMKLVACEEVSYRIAPSVAHIPWVTLKFLARELLLKGVHLNRVRWGHVLASVCSPFVGISRKRFGYFLVTAEKL